MKTIFKFLFLVITGRLRPAYHIIRDLRLSTKLAFIGMGLASYVVHQYPRELYVLGERGYFAALLVAQGSGDRIRLSESAQKNLAGLIGTLQADHTLHPKDLRPEKDASGWSTAQSLVAVGNLARVDAAQVRDYYAKLIDGDCGCWREEKKRQPHTGATGWIVFAMSEYGIELPPRTLSYLLEAQGAEGWWALHPATTDPRHASTYATAWATLALCTQITGRTGVAMHSEAGRIKPAVDKALDWLAKREIEQSAHWHDYPANSPQLKSASISGLVLHVKRKCGVEQDLPRQHRQWLSGMPAVIANAGTAEFSNMMLPLNNGVTEFDRTRHYVLQWTMIATVDAYANGSLIQRAATQQWLERILTPALVSEEVRKQSWVSAELLYALRHLSNHLDRPSRSGNGPQPTK